MTHHEIQLMPLFKKFISETKSGKRLKRNGKRIKPETIRNYCFVYANLESFIALKGFKFRLKPWDELDKREKETERNYWKKFYQQFTGFLYVTKKCHDNYVGSNIKILRLFFNYLQNDKMISTGNYFKDFFVIKEEPPILTLSLDQLKFLIYNRKFRESLPARLIPTLDMFLIGCTVSLRVSDLFNICKGDIIVSGQETYLVNCSQKTDTDIKVPLPRYAIEIAQHYSRGKRKANLKLFPKISLSHFNNNLKVIAVLAGWKDIIGKSRSRRGVATELYPTGGSNNYRFCDLISSHVMRRTAITTMLTLGMPEFLVRKVSGHSSNSQAFYRYVRFSQIHVNEELKKIQFKLEVDINLSQPHYWGSVQTI